MLRAHETELHAAGVLSVSVFGSVAREEAGPGPDVDVAVRLSESFHRAASIILDVSTTWSAPA
jgi:predicted nucleotidyltransferase